jgi:hypothetical protein
MPALEQSGLLTVVERLITNELGVEPAASTRDAADTWAAELEVQGERVEALRVTRANIPIASLRVLPVSALAARQEDVLLPRAARIQRRSLSDRH